MKQFVNSISAIGCNTKNQKGLELYNWCSKKYDKVLLNDSLDEQELKNDIREKIKELNEKFPRLKQDIEVVSDHRYSRDSIEVRWLDKNHSMVFRMDLQEVKGIMTGGCLNFE